MENNHVVSAITLDTLLAVMYAVIVMGALLISTEQRFVGKCQNCDFVVECGSAGAAESAATDHLAVWSIDEGFNNYSHIIEITSITVVGRI